MGLEMGSNFSREEVEEVCPKQDSEALPRLLPYSDLFGASPQGNFCLVYPNGRPIVSVSCSWPLCGENQVWFIPFWSQL